MEVGSDGVAVITIVNPPVNSLSFDGIHFRFSSSVTFSSETISSSSLSACLISRSTTTLLKSLIIHSLILKTKLILTSNNLKHSF